IAERLNSLSDRIVAVRGNCDSEVDQMLLKFPCMGDYSILVADGTRIMLTHGHKYNENNTTSPAVDAIFSGHTHYWKLERTPGGLLVCNTGSITFPKGDNAPTFATMDEDGMVRMRDLDGAVLKELPLAPKEAL
ncbi:MAG: phosphodiesterase, partial [Candidatus Cryptobacteroides sp.]